MKESKDRADKYSISRLKEHNQLWIDMDTAEEEMDARRRRNWLRYVIHGVLVECGKQPSDELLDEATSFAMSHSILPSLNPSRKGWFIDMLCCFCDGNPYECGEYKITYK